jgi:hypothetical protein
MLTLWGRKLADLVAVAGRSCVGPGSLSRRCQRFRGAAAGAVRMFGASNRASWRRMNRPLKSEALVCLLFVDSQRRGKACRGRSE